MKISEGDIIPGSNDYHLDETDEDWLEEVYLGYIQKSYDNLWVAELFDQQESDGKYSDEEFDKFAYTSSMESGFETGVESIINAMSQSAFDQINYEGTKEYVGHMDDIRVSDYYAMVDNFCNSTEYDDANFIVFGNSTVLVYGETIGTEYIKNDFTANQYTDKLQDRDVIQCYTHRRYDVNPDSYKVYIDSAYGDIHRKI